MDDEEAARSVRRTVERAAYVFYVDGRWRPFPDDGPESRVTKPDDTTYVQFNSIPGGRPHAEYRGPFGRWWVRIDPESGMPVGEPSWVPSADASSGMVN